MKNQNDIKVAIYIPTFNRARYIKQTISTLINQTYTNISITIVDNASMDNTEEIVRSIIDPRIKYIKNESNIGAINNFNKCIEISLFNNDQFMCIFHSEDLYHLSIVERELNLMLESDDIGVVFSNMSYVDEDNHDLMRIFEKRFEKDAVLSEFDLIETTLVYGTPLCCPTFMARTKVFRDVGYFEPKYLYAGDTEFYLRISKKFKIGIVSDALMKYRQSSIQESLIQLVDKKSISEEFILLNTKLLEYRSVLSREVVNAYNMRLAKEYLDLAQIALLKNLEKAEIVENTNRSIEISRFPLLTKYGFKQRLLNHKLYSFFKYIYLISKQKL